MKKERLFYWLPRIIAIIFIAFISIFALDSTSILGLFMHLIPTIFLTAILILAWFKELWGGILYIILGLFSIIFFNTYEHIISFLVISFPVILIGALFLFYFYKFKKK